MVLLHANGLGIHPLAEVASGVRLRHNVTIGVRRTGGTAAEELPCIGVGADIGAGAFILGPIEIGAGAEIGAAAVVLDDVPPGGVAVGNSAHAHAHGRGAPRCPDRPFPWRGATADAWP